MEVKINQKKYKVPELTFEHFTQIENQGFSLLEAFKKKQMMLMAMGFTCAVVGCEREEAEKLIEQHVLSGGSLNEIVAKFGEAISESVFFKKMLGLEEKEQENPEKDKNHKTEDK